MTVTIEDSLRGHFLRSIRRRVEAKKLADGMVRIPVDDAKLLLEIVELLDSDLRMAKGETDRLRGLLVNASIVAQPSMPLMMAIWNDGYSHGCDGSYSPTGDVHKGEPESLVETEVLRVLDAWGKASVSMVDGRLVYSTPTESLSLSAGHGPTVRLPAPDNMHGACDGFGGEDPTPRPIGNLGTWRDPEEAGCGKAIRLDASGRDMLAPGYTEGKQ